MSLPAGGSRLALSLALIGVAVVGGVRGDAAPVVAAAVPPEPDTWPVPALVSDLEGLLTFYYGQRADATTPLYYFAPEYERDKADAAKDPDTLWEYMGDPDTQCHTAATDAELDYLWRRQHGGTPVIAPDAIADADTNCRGDSGGLPWRSTYDWTTATETADLLDELGYGAHNESVQILGGLMRLIAARYPLDAVDPSLQAEYVQQRQTLLEPYYDDAYTRLKAILEMYRDSANGYGYVPEIENSTCVGFDPDPSDVGTKMMLTWQVGTGDTVEQTAIRRAMWYSIAALWYWWYDSGWLDVDAEVW